MKQLMAKIGFLAQLGRALVLKTKCEGSIPSRSTGIKFPLAFGANKTFKSLKMISLKIKAFLVHILTFKS